MKMTNNGKPPRKPFFNFKGWLGWNEIERGGTAIKTMAKDLFIPKEAIRTESFEESLIRLNLTEADILKQIKNFQRLFITFLIASFSLFFYAFYMLFNEAYTASLACFGLTAFLLAQTFRYHFWWFQMKRRKLGCSFREWLQGLLHLNEEGSQQ
jgi:intracellular multiplication protein IcmV